MNRCVCMLALLLTMTTLAFAAPEAERATVPLREGWTLASGCGVQATGATLSTPASPMRGIRVSVPSTVLAAQVAAGQFKDPYVGMNLRDIPGASYPIGENFSNLPMPADSPYRCSWWYRDAFTVPAADRGKTLTLHFGGINYRANIWLNGKLVADTTRIAGAYRTYDLDITQFSKPGGLNVLAVETMAPTETDLGINWVDWSPCPPDKDMGLTGDVALQATGPVTVRSPLVSTHFRDASLNEAALTVVGELQNASAKPVQGVARAALLGMALEQPVSLAPGEHATVVFGPERYPQLRVEHPQVWWPYGMGEPRLSTASLSFLADGQTSDAQQIRFGVREMTSELTDKGHRLFRINGKPLLIRGAGWSQDMLLREDRERLAQQFAMVRDLHLNTIRLEGKLETESFYDLADEQGMLVLAGWCCCDQWEHWDKWTPENRTVAAESLRAQMLRIRAHPSLLAWLNGSDNPPPADVEQVYLDVERETRWPNPALSSASGTATTVSGASGVKMSGPYDFVAPSYWLVDTGQHGGAFGFNTETSPGPAIPTAYSLRKFLPADQLWPPNRSWSFHNGGEGFQNLEVFNTALAATYGPATSLADYERVSQAMAYDGERAMFEAYGRNKYTATGVVQWMLNNAWPSMIWHLYDYYLDAGGGYYGARKACEPLHIQYSYDDHSVFVVNSRYQPAPALHASVHVYDAQLKPVLVRDAQLDVGADASSRALDLPADAFSLGSSLYFVDLTLKNSAGEIVSRNFYYVPATLTTFDWAKTDYTHTPALQHEQLTALRALPASAVTVELLPPSGATGEAGIGRESVRVRLRNSSPALALQVAVHALDASGEAIDPVFWSDNYVTLLPGEEQVLTAKLWGREPRHVAGLALSGWNVPETTIQLPREPSVAGR